MERVRRVGGVTHHVGARGAFRPARVGRVGSVGHLDHPEQEPAGAVEILGRQELPEEQVGAVIRPERRLKDASTEQPPLVLLLHRSSLSAVQDHVEVLEEDFDVVFG